MKKRITVFTPTYNRAFCIGQVYESLVAQTNPDFVWLIIDDGSTDGTDKLVQSWIESGKIEIKYVYQQNQGMHGAHNTAYENIETELNVCIDSDDFMPEDAIEKILSIWDARKAPNYAGIIGLDAFKDGSIVGRAFPENFTSGKYGQLKKMKIGGDKKFVYRTEVISKYPKYPIFEGERFVPLNYKYLLIDAQYDMIISNEVFCIVEYLEDGSSRNIVNSYKKNPRGFAHERLVRMQHAFTIKERFQNAVHYVSSSLFTKNKQFLSQSTNKPLTLLALPFGLLLHLYIRKTTNTGWKK